MRLAKKVNEKIPAALITILLGVLLWGSAQELNAHYQEALRGGGLPKSFLSVGFLIVVVAVLSLAFLWAPRLLAPLQVVRKPLYALGGAIGWVLALALASGLCWLLVFTKWSGVFNGAYTRIFFFLSAAGVMAWLLTRRGNFEFSAWLAAFIGLGTVLSLLLAFQDVNAFPLSQGWSEGNRIYDYSVLFGRGLYLYPADQPLGAFIDWGRQSLWGLPFLLPGVTILGVRFWSAVVFTVPYAILGWMILKPEKQNIGAWLLFGLWSFLFLNQGPIYTPLVLAGALVALSRRTPTLAALILVGIAGYYTRISRYTWLFAPAIWGGLVALLETSPYGVRTLFDRWKRAILIGLGGLVGGYLVPEVILPKIFELTSGVKAGASIISAEGISGAVGRQPLLWDRLWPNQTYAPGIVFALLMATGPLLVLMAIYLFTGRWKLSAIQKLALSGVLLVFLAVGIVASVKIGGGSNLHNLDMFLIAMLFAVGLAWETGAGEWLLRAGRNSWWMAFLILAVAAYPASNGLLSAVQHTFPNPRRVSDAIEQIQKYADASKGKGDVLFIDQRQLLTFGKIHGVALLPDYEKKLMMDQAMSENLDYFKPFYQDLAKHRFAMIVVEPLWVHFQGEQYEFGNENDAWVKYVSIPVLCYYEPVESNLDAQVQILAPKEKSAPADNVTCPQY
jgi:hypothetical protein